MVKRITPVAKVKNFVNSLHVAPAANQYFTKLNPHNGKIVCEAARSNQKDVNLAVQAAKKVQKSWAFTPAVKRGEVLFEIANLMQQYRDDIATIVALETGKAKKEALGETDGAITLARFMAGEGTRFYGRTTTSAVPNKYAMTVREPVGVAGLIIAANTPIANVAWKVFPALICGNTAILKPAEDTPLTAWIFAEICRMSSLPKGVLNIIHGLGEEAGAPLVEHPDVNLISFTGSTEVGRYIARVAGERLTKISLELGGKNPMIICDDADLENAVKWAALSAFSNAGQRCAAASRIIVTKAVYGRFRKMFLEKTKTLKVGNTDKHDFGPVINQTQLDNVLAAIERARKEGAKILFGGHRLVGKEHKGGNYLAPTIIEGVEEDDFISQTELFAPVTILYQVDNFEQALAMANRSPYGLTAAIHTSNVNLASEFVRKVEAGVAVVNGGTYGSEPHMPFGGVKQSGNGTREPGTEAIDVYSNIKDIYGFINLPTEK